MSLITLTYSIGSDGQAIGEQVAKNLSLELYNDQKIQHMVAALGVSELEQASLDEKTPRLLDRLFSKKPQLYLDVMEAVIYDIAKKGQGVIIGHGSQFLLQEFSCAFHVKIHAGRALRIQRLMEQQGLDYRTAQKLTRNADEQQRGFFRYAFQSDLDKTDAYDPVINREKLSPSAATKIIVDALHLDEIKECSLSAYVAMEKLAHERKIHSKMVDNHIDLSTLNITVSDDGMVHITGMASSEADRDKLPEVLENLQRRV